MDGAVEPGDTKHVEVVDVPAEVYAWKADPEQREAARAVQTRNRERLQMAFARGLAAIGYERDGAGNGRYLLGHARDVL